MGGWGCEMQLFDANAVAWPVNILMLSFAAIMLPTAMTTFGSNGGGAIVRTSRALSLMLILSYACYMLFTLKTHYETFVVPQQEARNRSRRRNIVQGTAINSVAATGAAISASVGGAVAQGIRVRKPIEDRLPSLSIWGLIFTLCVDIALLGVCTTFMVDSIDGLTQKTLLSQSFVGVILLPLLSCNLHAIKLAREDKLQQCFELTINNSVQVLLFILPLAVMIGWVRDDPSMTLLFDTPQVISLGLSIWILRTITQDGQSHW